MDSDNSDEFDRFVLYGKVIELLDRHSIKPTDVWIDIGFDENEMLFALDDRTTTFLDGSTTITNPEHNKKLEHVRTDLGFRDGRTVGRFTDYPELYDKLCTAIEKAPKSLTRFR